MGHAATCQMDEVSLSAKYVDAMFLQMYRRGIVHLEGA